jgi:hypothetical protein
MGCDYPWLECEGCSGRIDHESGCPVAKAWDRERKKDEETLESHKRYLHSIIRAFISSSPFDHTWKEIEEFIEPYVKEELFKAVYKSWSRELQERYRWVMSYKMADPKCHEPFINRKDIKGWK